MENENKTTDEIKEESQEATVTDLKKDKNYRKGQLIYDISMFIFILLLLFRFALNFMQIELYSGGVFFTSYLNYIYIIPCILMLVGLKISISAAKKHKKEEKKDKIWFTVLSIVTAAIILLCIVDTFHPSYHVYSIEETKADNGTVFTIAKSETVSFTGEVHSTMPSFYDIDVYTVNGIFAKRLVKVPTHKGPFEIKHLKGNDYRITVAYLGIQEGFPFNSEFKLF